MKLLLDTHVLIWAAHEPERLSAAARNAIANADNAVFVSAASAWEIAIKHAAGRIVINLDLFGSGLELLGYERLNITFDHSIEAGGLPRHHADPFDRMLIAQGRCEGMTLVTADGLIEPYDVRVMKA